MRSALRVLLATGLLVSAAGVGAKGRPEPVTCPADVPSAMALACPCDGKVLPDGSVLPWRNHGQYVSCVVRYRNALRKAGCLTDEARREIARCAARSTCGKNGAVLCCVSELGTCNDPTPGDMVAAGTCSNDATLPCDVSTDCTKTSGRVVHDEATCMAAGGTAVQGSVCTGCRAQ